jgi:hypothetical protein
MDQQTTEPRRLKADKHVPSIVILLFLKITKFSEYHPYVFVIN